MIEVDLSTQPDHNLLLPTVKVHQKKGTFYLMRIRVQDNKVKRRAESNYSISILLDQFPHPNRLKIWIHFHTRVLVQINRSVNTEQSNHFPYK